MSKRITQTFAKCRQEKRAAFIPFIMAGDPDLSYSAALLHALPHAGADMIEIGVPFSDPMADGPIIQAAGLRALAAGTTIQHILDMVLAFRTHHPDVPIILMGYYNPVYRFGIQSFAQTAKRSGVDGVIIVDVPPEEEKDITNTFEHYDIDFVRLVAPTSLATRLPTILNAATGYIYYIAIAGITGAAAADNAKLASQVAILKQATDLPVAVGFGVKERKQIETIGAYADAVVVGSAIVAKIAEYAQSTQTEFVKHVCAFITSLSGRSR